jgi:colanic acid biosynthesis glycosyl transferase WcaI
VTSAEDGLRILVVGLNYAPEEIGIARYTAGMAEMLTQRGHQVDVIAGQPYYPQWQVYAGYRGWRARTERRNGVNVARCPHYVPADPSGVKRILHLASFALSALPSLVRSVLRRRKRRPQVIICIAPALFSVVPAWIAARLSGAKLWVHVQDFEVEAALATGLMRPGSMPARLALWLEGRILGLADSLSSISPQMCARLAAKAGTLPDAVLQVRNWADGNFVADPEGAARLRTEWNLGDRKIALYSGNIARKQGIEILVEVARILLGRDDVAIVICGEGPNRAELAALSAGLPNVHLHDLQPMERVPALLTLADVHLLPQIPGAADLVLPSKLTNMLASGRPVVATAAMGTGLADEMEGCGLVTEPGDAPALAKALERLLADDTLAAQMGETASQRAADRWSAPAIMTQLEQQLVAMASAA